MARAWATICGVVGRLQHIEIVHVLGILKWEHENGLRDQRLRHDAVRNVLKFSLIEHAVFVPIELCPYIIRNDDMTTFGRDCDSLDVVDQLAPCHVTRSVEVYVLEDVIRRRGRRRRR